MAEPVSRTRLSAGRVAAARRLLARGQLPVGRADLPARQPAAARAAARRARQAAAARPLGHDARAEPPLRAPEPGDPASATWTRSTSPAPATAGPALVANAYLEGTYSEVYPHIGRGRGRACARCSASSPSPAASRSHVAPETPGSIHEGGELGYALVARVRRGVRQPRPARRSASSATARRRPGRSPRAGTRTSSSNPRTDGAVLPILHLNGYKIANPTVLARIPRATSCVALLEGYGYAPLLRRGRRPDGRCTSALAAALDEVLDEIAAIQRAARERRDARAAALADDRAAHAEGLDRAEGGRRAAGRGHVALAPGAARRRPRQPRAPARSSRTWLRSYRPEELFDDDGRAACPSSRALAPDGRPADERQPARQRRRAAARPRRCPTSATTPSTVEQPAHDVQRGDPRARRRSCATSSRATRRPFRLFGPDETASNRLGAVFEVTDRAWDGRDRGRPTSTSRPTAG